MTSIHFTAEDKYKAARQLFALHVSDAEVASACQWTLSHTRRVTSAQGWKEERNGCPNPFGRQLTLLAKLVTKSRQSKKLSLPEKVVMQTLAKPAQTNWLSRVQSTAKRLAVGMEQEHYPFCALLEEHCPKGVRLPHYFGYLRFFEDQVGAEYLLSRCPVLLNVDGLSYAFFEKVAAGETRLTKVAAAEFDDYLYSAAIQLLLERLKDSWPDKKFLEEELPDLFVSVLTSGAKVMESNARAYHQILSDFYGIGLPNPEPHSLEWIEDNRPVSDEFRLFWHRTQEYLKACSDEFQEVVRSFCKQEQSTWKDLRLKFERKLGRRLPVLDDSLQGLTVPGHSEGLSERLIRNLTDSARGEVIETIGKLAHATADELLSRRQFAVSSLEEVEEALDAIGLRLGMTEEELLVWTPTLKKKEQAS